MTFEITLDMEALGEDDTILVKDEFGEYPDCEYVPKSIHDQLKAENEKLRELLSMYITFAREFAEGCILHRMYCDGMGKKMNETKMRERALELGVKECR
jgi:hypothetical protein